MDNSIDLSILEHGLSDSIKSIVAQLDCWEEKTDKRERDATREANVKYPNRLWTGKRCGTFRAKNALGTQEL
jgi:hypothetical protein